MILKVLFVHNLFFKKRNPIDLYKSSGDCMYEVQCSVLTRSADVEQDSCHAVYWGGWPFWVLTRMLICTDATCQKGPKKFVGEIKGVRSLMRISITWQGCMHT